jgi:hypothetical protein
VWNRTVESGRRYAFHKLEEIRIAPASLESEVKDLRHDLASSDVSEGAPSERFTSKQTKSIG